MMYEDVLESLPLGILVFNTDGTPVLTNSYAQQICCQLLKIPAESTQNYVSSSFPPSISRICQAVLDSRELFPERPIIIEDAIPLSASTTVQLRARWLDLEIEPYILMMLEVQQQMESYTEPPIQLQLEARHLKLTHRETQVWLLRRAGYPYKAIATHLQITLNTVKKHIKSIHAKREMAKWLSEAE
jgi:DNA-binding NarL/FixJ family response regulator